MGPVADSSVEQSTLVEQIILTSSDSDYLNQLIPVVRDARYTDDVTQLIDILNRLVNDCQTKIKRLCNSNHQDFVSSVNRLLNTREGSASLTAEILDLTEPIESSTEHLLAQKQALLASRNVRDNINETARVLNACLQVLQSANAVHELLAQKNYYGALRSLQQLQDVHLRDVKRYKIAEVISRSVPDTMQLISNAVMEDLHTWLSEIREKNQYLGKIAFYHTKARLERQKSRADEDFYFSNFGLNSAVEIVADETDDFNFLYNQEMGVDIDFFQLLKAIHIHNTLGKADWFRAEYALTRQRQMKLIFPDSIVLGEGEEGMLGLLTLLANVIGFAIMEKCTMKNTDGLRSPSEVDELWESMSKSVVSLVSQCLSNVVNPKVIVQVKIWIGMLTHTMVPWGYSIAAYDSLTVKLFEQYINLLKNQMGTGFAKILEDDDYMPMPVQSREDYEKILKQAWYMPEKEPEKLRFPMYFPFSQMYPLACKDTKDFVNQIYLFPDENLSRMGLIDQMAIFALDELLRDKVCKPLVERLDSHNSTQVAQIYTNLNYFEQFCDQIVHDLFSHRPTVASTQSLHLNTKEEFQKGGQLAQKRLFYLVNSKIDALIGTAEYDWNATKLPTEPSFYIPELIEYLSVSTMLALPADIKRQIFYDTISRACIGIVALPLDSNVTSISPAAIQAMDLDLESLSQFVRQYVNQYPVVRDALSELAETVALMRIEDPKLFFDEAYRNKHFPRVKYDDGKALLEKVSRVTPPVVQSSSSPQPPDKASASLSARFGFR